MSTARVEPDHWQGSKGKEAMKSTRRWPWRLTAAVTLAMVLAAFAGPASADNGKRPPKTSSRIRYHNGPVMDGTSNVYLIWYGCWEGCPTGSNPDAMRILTELVINLSVYPYFQINAGYPSALGAAPSGALFYGGAVADGYSHGTALTRADLADIVLDLIQAGALPLDGAGIYVVLTSADVTVVDGTTGATEFCVTCCQFHDHVDFLGVQVKYAFVGNAQRCPSVCAAQFVGPTPNDNLAADAMASWLVHALSGTVTNPTGLGWYDRYGLENSDKCQGTYGETYLTANGARANIQLGTRHYLLQQNWVNAKRGYCAMSDPE